MGRLQGLDTCLKAMKGNRETRASLGQPTLSPHQLQVVVIPLPPRALGPDPRRELGTQRVPVRRAGPGPGLSGALGLLRASLSHGTDPALGGRALAF